MLKNLHLPVFVACLCTLTLFQIAAPASAQVEPRLHYGMNFRYAGSFNPAARRWLHDFRFDFPRLEDFQQEATFCASPSSPYCFLEDRLKNVSQSFHDSLSEEYAKLIEVINATVEKVEYVDSDSESHLRLVPEERMFMQDAEHVDMGKEIKFRSQPTPLSNRPMHAFPLDDVRMRTLSLWYMEMERDLRKIEENVAELGTYISDLVANASVKTASTTAAWAMLASRHVQSLLMMAQAAKNVESLASEHILSPLLSLDDLSVTLQAIEHTLRFYDIRFHLDNRPLTSVYSDRLKVVRDDFFIHVLVDIPVAARGPVMALYRAEVFPLVVGNRTNDTITLTDIPAFLAVSNDSSTYVILSEHDVNQCWGHPAMCDQVLSVSTADVPTCIWGLFKKDNSMISEKCTFRVKRHKEIKPGMKEIEPGWFVLTKIREVLVDCPSVVGRSRLSVGCLQCVKRFPCQCSLRAHGLTMQGHLNPCPDSGVSHLKEEDLSQPSWLMNGGNNLNILRSSERYLIVFPSHSNNRTESRSGYETDAWVIALSVVLAVLSTLYVLYLCHGFWTLQTMLDNLPPESDTGMEYEFDLEDEEEAELETIIDAMESSISI